jgi:DNA polymerase I
MPKTRYPDWRQLPYREIWVEDTEYYSGAGLANGGREGDLPTPLCLSAIELRSNRLVQWWQGEPYPAELQRLGPDDLYVSYLLTAEYSQRRAHGLGRPPNAIDAYVEFRRLVNDARVRSGDRPKGFYSLAGALRHFNEDEIDAAHKEDTRDLIMRGPPFSNEKRAVIERYNLDDVHAAARVFKQEVPTIPSWRHALYRGEFEWGLSDQERRGAPIDLIGHNRISDYWNAIKVDLVTGIDRRYGVYEIVDGEPHFHEDWFREYLDEQRPPIRWPTLKGSADLDLKARTFRDMAGAHKQIADLHALRCILAQLRNNRLAVGNDGYNRCLQGPYGTKTGRNAWSNSKCIWGPAKGLRFLIMPTYGSALCYRDFKQQEVRIAAIKSGDMELLTVCEAGDVYNGIARQLGYRENRPLFKTVVLGILYGLEAQSLAWRAGISVVEAAEILNRLRARFRTFEEYCSRVHDHAGLDLVLTTNFGWTMQCPPGTNRRIFRNWGPQSTGAEIMHIFTILAERRGLPICSTIHDAAMAHGEDACIDDISRELDRTMGDASALVLDGYRLPTDDGSGPIRFGQRFYDKNGEVMWDKINELIDKLERRRA